MDKIYSQIWKLAKPYYKIGRSMDIDHIEWMMKDALLVCEKERLDDSLLLPLVILHDVGYSKAPKKNPWGLDMRKIHMREGEIITRKILTELNYPPDKIEKICYYVSVHDNWAYGDIEPFNKEKILGVFTDLDFTWMATPKGFPAVMEILNKDEKEMIEYLEDRETPAKGLPFSTKTTKELFEKYMDDRKKEESS